jgi:hypothetical protein
VDPREQTSVEVLSSLLHEPAPSGPGPRPRPGDHRTRPPTTPGPNGPRATGPRPTAAPVLVVRAIAGAALSVCGVGLGIVGLALTAPAPERIAAGAEQAASSPASSPSASPTPSPVAPPAAAAPRAAASPVLPTPTVAPPARVAVTVLNNSRIPRLAARGAQRFTAAGWPVAAVGNFRGRIPVTTVYYDPGQEAAARELAGAVDGVARVRPRFAGLPARGVVVVLTREFPL